MTNRADDPDHDKHGAGWCCDDYPVDSVHSPACHTTDGVYRCEECDTPFERKAAGRKLCMFCGGTDRTVGM